MTIATKNGVPIVKSGAIASNCGCCGEWYCCDTRVFDRSCTAAGITPLASLVVTIEASDFVSNEILTAQCFAVPGQPAVTIRQTSTFITPGASLAGTFVLTPTLVSTSTVQEIWRYKYVYPADSAGCVGNEMETFLTIQNSGGLRLIVNALSLSYRYYGHSTLKSGAASTFVAQPRDMSCSSTSSGKSPCSTPRDVNGSSGDVLISKYSSTDLVAPIFEASSTSTFACTPQDRLVISRSGGSLLRRFTQQGGEIGEAATNVIVFQQGSRSLSATMTLTLL